MALLSVFAVHVDKLTLYLLNADHPRGGSKARLLIARGFSRDRPDELAHALTAHAGAETTFGMVAEHDMGGQRLVLEGPLICPDGTAPRFRTIWRFQEGSDTAFFITAYPARPKS